MLEGNRVFRRGVSAVDRGLNAAVSVLVVVLLLGMVLLSFTQVLLRNIFGGGIAWADVVLRHLVLAVGMFGAVIATRQGRQISIDVISRIVGPRMRIALGWIAGFFTITISVLMARAAIVFVASEKAFSSEIGSGLKAWPFETVIPVGFGLIALQVVINLLLGRGNSEPALADHPVLPSTDGPAHGADLLEEAPAEDNPVDAPTARQESPAEDLGDEHEADEEEGQ